MRAGLAMALLVRDGPFHAARVRPSEFWRAVGSRGSLLALGGYLGHMALRDVPGCPSTSSRSTAMPRCRVFGSRRAARRPSLSSPWAQPPASSRAAAERYGWTAVTAAAMAASGTAALVAGFGPGVILVTVVALLWGATVVADSVHFSTAMTELADERYPGSALAFQAGVGFLLTAITIRAVPAIVVRLVEDQHSPYSPSAPRWASSPC